MEFGWSAEETQFRTDLRKFVDERIPADWRGNPRHRQFNPGERKRVTDFTHELAARGWLTPHWPIEYGGQGLSAWKTLILGEEMWSVGEPRGPQYMSVNWIGPAIMVGGNQEQKEQHLTQISSGDAFWCQGFSEPDAGSDLASLKTSAVRDGDHYVVNGQKIWTSHTQLAEWCFLLVRTSSDKHGGISILLVPMNTPGIEVRLIPNLAEKYGLAEVFFSDVRVPVANRLGEENAGWDVVRAALQHERVGAARWERDILLLDALAQIAKDQGRIEEPDILRALGLAYGLVESARHLAYTVIDQRAKGRLQDAQAYVSRVATVRAERAVAEAFFDIAGANVVDENTLANENYFSGYTAGVAAGTYEVNLNLVAQQVLGLPRK